MIRAGRPRSLRLPAALAGLLAGLLLLSGCGKPATLAERLDRGRAAYRDGRFREATANFRRAVKLEAGSAEAHVWLSGALYQRRRYAEALAAADRAAALAPADARAQAARGTLLAAVERRDEALEALTRAVELDPRSVSARALRAQLLGLGGSGEERARALSDWEAVLKLSPEHSGAHAARGELLEAAGRDAEALAAFTAALRLDARNAPAHLGRGRLLARTGSDPAALVDLNEALALDPGLAGAYLERSAILERRGLLAQAVADCSAAIALDPAVPPAYARRGRLRARQGYPRRALPDLDRALAAGPDDAGSRLARAGALLLLGRYGPAEGDGARALAILLEGKRAGANYARGLALYGLGRGGESAAALDEAARERPAIDPTIRLIRFLASARAGAREEAAGRLERAIPATDPTSLERALLRFSLGQIPAEELLERQGGVEKWTTTERATVYYQIAAVSELSGRRDLAERYYFRCAQTDAPTSYLPALARSDLARLEASARKKAP